MCFHMTTRKICLNLETLPTGFRTVVDYIGMPIPQAGPLFHVLLGRTLSGRLDDALDGRLDKLTKSVDLQRPRL